RHPHLLPLLFSQRHLNEPARRRHVDKPPRNEHRQIFLDQHRVCRELDAMVVADSALRVLEVHRVGRLVGEHQQVKLAGQSKRRRMKPYAESPFAPVQPVAPHPPPLLHRLHRRFHVPAPLHLVGARELDRHHMMVVGDPTAVVPLLQVGYSKLDSPLGVNLGLHPISIIRIISRLAATSFSHTCSIRILPSLPPSVSSRRANISLRRVESSGPLKTLYWI